MPTTIMSADNSYRQSVEASTPGSDTPSTSDIMSTTPTVELQITSPTNENIFNKRLVDHNTVIEKELVTVNEENVKLKKVSPNDCVDRINNLICDNKLT
jgi:hypothetical protein